MVRCDKKSGVVGSVTGGDPPEIIYVILAECWRGPMSTVQGAAAGAEQNVERATTLEEDQEWKQEQTKQQEQA